MLRASVCCAIASRAQEIASLRVASPQEGETREANRHKEQYKLMARGCSEAVAQAVTMLTHSANRTGKDFWSNMKEWDGEPSPEAAKTAQDFRGKLDQKPIRLVVKDGTVREITETSRTDAMWHTCVHATTVRGAVGVMHDGYLKGREWNKYGAGTHGIYCYAAPCPDPTNVLADQMEIGTVWNCLLYTSPSPRDRG